MDSSDADAPAVRALLREALVTSGLSQEVFARALETSPFRFSAYLAGTSTPPAHLLAQAQRRARALEAAGRQGLMTALTTASALREQLRAGDVSWAWRVLLQGRDHLRLMLGRQDDELLGSWEAAPTSTGSVGFNALLAAVTRHEFEAARRSAPDWSCTKPLDRPWMPEHPFLTPERVVAETPEWLQRLNIFVPQRDLTTA